MHPDHSMRTMPHQLPKDTFGHPLQEHVAAVGVPEVLRDHLLANLGFCRNRLDRLLKAIEREGLEVPCDAVAAQRPEDRLVVRAGQFLQPAVEARCNV
jgi:hypothetical protein